MIVLWEIAHRGPGAITVIGFADQIKCNRLDSEDFNQRTQSVLNGVIQFQFGMVLENLDHKGSTFEFCGE